MPEERAIETSRPPTVVTFIVKINGNEIPGEFRAETIIINKEVNRISSARVVFVDGSASEEQFAAGNGSLCKNKKQQCHAYHRMQGQGN